MVESKESGITCKRVSECLIVVRYTFRTDTQKKEKTSVKN